jgi:NADP-dependent 3-hydroxy acid dehydrogenase YdfG
MSILKSFRDQVVVITGASSGIGRAIALSFAEQGAVCCLIARNKERLEEVAKIARLHSNLVQIYPYDLLVEENIKRMEMQIRENFGRVDILVHSAGIYISSLLKDAMIEDFDKQYLANVRAPYLLTQSLLPMIRFAKGQIVFMNSTQGLNANPLLSQYASTQHSLKAIADSLREEVNPDGVRVLSLFLGRTATPRMKIIFEKENKIYDPSVLIQPEDVASVVSHTLSLPRTAEVTNINIRPMIKSY